MSAVADSYKRLQALGVEVISVSVDSHFVHKMWNDHELVKMVEGGVPFHMASDQAGNIGRAYGVWDEGQGIELRGRFIIDPGKSPHAPHVHDDEEILIVETGHGEIICDGKTTKVGPGSVMYSTPNVAHGINNTSNEPLTFYFVKWTPKGSPSK